MEDSTLSFNRNLSARIVDGLRSGIDRRYSRKFSLRKLHYYQCGYHVPVLHYGFYGIVIRTGMKTVLSGIIRREMKLAPIS